MMHITLGLLVLYFVSCHGVINKCYIGGVNESNCDKINEGSVLRLYISNYRSKSNPEVDIPYTYYQHDDHIVAPSNITLTECSPISLLDLLFLENEKLHLVKEWNEVLNHGTDIHRLKFHNKLVNMYRHKDKSEFTKKFTFKMIFIKSCYLTASMYYLANYQKHAFNVIREVMYFFGLEKKNLKQINIDLKELIVWKLLFYTLKLNIIESSKNMPNPYPIDWITAVKENITQLKGSLEIELNKMPTKIKQYPCPYILMFQSYFLDKDMNNEEKINLTNILKVKLIDCNECHSDANLYSMYKYLATTIIEPNTFEIDNYNAFSNLILALERPVLCIEDRLLNYKATLMMMDLYKNCIEETILNKELCIAIEYRRKNDIKTRNILEKITYLITYDRKTQDIKQNLIINDEIDEDFVHMIVTMAIDMDSNSESYEKKRNNVKTSIAILEDYVKEVNKKNLNTITRKKLKLAYKWLFELNAILCDGSKKNEVYQTSYTDVRSMIVKNKWDLDVDDTHLRHLGTKEYWSNIRILFSWENYSETGGWILPKIFTYPIEDFKHCIDEFINDLTSRSPFINYTYILIQLSRYYFVTDFSEALMYITEALRMPVITPEDRYRNIVAHEIHSMMFMIHNSNVIEGIDAHFSYVYDPAIIITPISAAHGQPQRSSLPSNTSTAADIKISTAEDASSLEAAKDKHIFSRRIPVLVSSASETLLDGKEPWLNSATVDARERHILQMEILNIQKKQEVEKLIQEKMKTELLKLRGASENWVFDDNDK